MIARNCSLFLLVCTATSTVASPVIARKGTASSTSVAPAATTVPADSSTGVDLFDNEAIQLTEQVLKDVSSQTNDTNVIALFDFQNDTDSDAAALSRRSGACKAFPGDWNYPKSLTWSLFDLLLGRALIKTTPVAAPCYKSSGVYNAAKCADISKRFTTADLQ